MCAHMATILTHWGPPIPCTTTLHTTLCVPTWPPSSLTGVRPYPAPPPSTPHYVCPHGHHPHSLGSAHTLHHHPPHHTMCAHMATILTHWGPPIPCTTTLHTTLC